MKKLNQILQENLSKELAKSFLESLPPHSFCNKVQILSQKAKKQNEYKEEILREKLIFDCKMPTMLKGIPKENLVWEFIENYSKYDNICDCCFSFNVLKETPWEKYLPELSQHISLCDNLSKQNFKRVKEIICFNAQDENFIKYIYDNLIMPFSNEKYKITYSGENGFEKFRDDFDAIAKNFNDKILNNLYKLLRKDVRQNGNKVDWIFKNIQVLIINSIIDPNGKIKPDIVKKLLLPDPESLNAVDSINFDSNDILYKIFSNSLNHIFYEKIFEGEQDFVNHVLLVMVLFFLIKASEDNKFAATLTCLAYSKK